MSGGSAVRLRIRVALLVDSLILPKWIHRIVQQILESASCEIVLVVRNAAPPTHRSLGRRLMAERQHLLYLLYSKVDSLLFQQEPDPFRREDLGALVEGVPLIDVTPRMTAFSDYFEQPDLERIRQHDVDVALRFGFRILRGGALSIARYGVWSYHHGDNRVNRGGPPGFWEVMEGIPVTGSVLQILSEELDAGRVIYRSFAKTHPWSVIRNQRNYYWKSAEFVGRKLRDLAELGSEGLRDVDADDSPWHPYSERLYTRPRNAHMLRLLARIGGRMVKDLFRRAVTRDEWQLEYRFDRRPIPAAPADHAFHRFTPLTPPRDRLWADPWPVKTDHGFAVFVEELPFSTQRGHIALLEVDANGSWSGPTEVLRRDYHLSYPCVFRWAGAHYMIPESKQNRTVELYRAVSFPRSWKLDRVLLSDVQAVDATVREIRGRWWMFVNIGVDGASVWDELHLFHADTPLGPWEPHRRNPVKSDIRSARPAGGIFCWNGNYFRPAQDCSIRYGYAIGIHRITRIDPEAYAEEHVATIRPNWRSGLIGTHTLNAADGLTMVDAARRHWRAL